MKTHLSSLPFPSHPPLLFLSLSLSKHILNNELMIKAIRITQANFCSVENGYSIKAKVCTLHREQSLTPLNVNLLILNSFHKSSENGPQPSTRMLQPQSETVTYRVTFAIPKMRLKCYHSK